MSLILTLIDIISKYLLTDKTYFPNQIFFIKFTHNFGSAFSIFSNFNLYSYIIILLSFLVIYVLIKLSSEFKTTKTKQISYYLIFAGILGNLYDRIIFGYVRDFIGIKYLFIFNIADAYLTIAIILYMYSEYYSKKQ